MSAREPALEGIFHAWVTMRHYLGRNAAHALLFVFSHSFCDTRIERYHTNCNTKIPHKVPAVHTERSRRVGVLDSDAGAQRAAGHDVLGERVRAEEVRRRGVRRAQDAGWLLGDGGVALMTGKERKERS